MFNCNNSMTKSKYSNHSSKIVAGEIKDETDGVTAEYFVVLEPKMYSLLIDDNSEYKKAKGVKKMLLQQYVIMNAKCFVE